MARVPYLADAGDILYLTGFWVEYGLLCAARAAVRVSRAVGSYAWGVLRPILRAFSSGIAGLLRDLLAAPLELLRGLTQMGSLTAVYPVQDPAALRAGKAQDLRRSLWRMLGGWVSLLLPLAAAAVLVGVVRAGIGRNFVLDVRVNGENVGYVQSEQVFETARNDVTARLDNARAVMQAAGIAIPEDTNWTIEPTYTLTVGEPNMNQLELADAIMGFAGGEIGNATAVYVDDELRYVTNEGDHLRVYLARYKAPQEDAFDPNTIVRYLHDIRLVDGMYMVSSIVPFDSVISAFNEGAEIFTYTAGEGETVQSAVDNTGVSFDSLAMMNPDLLSLDQEIPAGTVLTTGAASPELLKLKVIRRQTYTEAIPFNTENSESDEYDFGKKVTIREGEEGLQEVTLDTTFIDDAPVSSDIVNIDILKEPVNQITVTGTHLASGMFASVGTGSFVWPVPQYNYVSRWMDSGHRGADICANYATPIIASDGGAVIEAGWHYSWGNYVKIDHGNGWATLYGHMSSIAVSRGQAVSQGQVIGYVGSTGYSFGNHCHFEMYYNGALYSAANLFRGAVRGG